MRHMDDYCMMCDTMTKHTVTPDEQEEWNDVTCTACGLSSLVHDRSLQEG